MMPQHTKANHCSKNSVQDTQYLAFNFREGFTLLRYWLFEVKEENILIIQSNMETVTDMLFSL